MSKRACRTTMAVFLAFIALFFLLNLFVPDRSFSDRENRYLQTLPEFSFRDLFSGKFMSEFESYTSDQFVFRDSWTALKARLELLQGKQENNGVFLCAGERLLEPFQAPAQTELDARIRAVNALAENADVPVTLGLIPTASEIYADQFPAGTPTGSQADVIRYVYARVSSGTADLYGALSAHGDDDIFYRTDHHWTSLGAYWGYCALTEAPRSLDSFQRRTVTEAFYGTAYSASGFSWVRPDSMETFVQAPEQLQIWKYEGAEPAESPLYDTSKLEGWAKYSFFLGGNTPRLVVNTGKTDKPTLLILRDSFCDSLLPFLLEDYGEIHLLDLRYYRSSVATYIAENGIDSVLILYSVPNFCTDTNLPLMAG